MSCHPVWLHTPGSYGPLGLLCLLLGLAGVVAAASPSQQEGGESARVSLIDNALIDQNGHPARFASELIGDRLVVATTVYTTCTTVCPITSAILSRLQTLLGDRLDSEVRLLSVSVDPGTDTPARLKAMAARYHARPGWYWLTGNKALVDEVLEGLGAYSADFTAHPSVFLIGDGRRGSWRRVYGFASPTSLLARLDELARARSRPPASPPVSAQGQ